MNLHSRHVAAALAAACLVCTFPSAIARQLPPQNADLADHAGPGPDAPPADAPRGPGRGGPREHGPQAYGPHPFLAGVALSEAQQDRLFAIMHEAAPQRREHDKARRKAHEALRALSAADKFDEARAAAAAQALGQAIAAEELLCLRVDARVMGLLTPQQREQLRQDRAARGPRQ